jgi:hypothetical protein
VTATLRPDLADAHERTWDAMSSAGTWWSASERRALATAAIDAMWSGNSEPSSLEDAPEAALRAAARLGSGRPHVTREWYEDVRDEIGALPYVELVGLVAVASAASSLRRTLGLPDRDLSTDDERGPSRTPSPALADANWNWVPVAVPADENAAVVQALTAVPATFDELWRLADAQYIPDLEMVDPKWTRGTLSRVDMELLATRVSFSRECHY